MQAYKDMFIPQRERPQQSFKWGNVRIANYHFEIKPAPLKCESERINTSELQTKVHLFTVYATFIQSNYQTNQGTMRKSWQGNLSFLYSFSTGDPHGAVPGSPLRY